MVSAAHGRGDALGVVLAGGAGTRVGGKDKGLLPLHGRPLIDHVLERVRAQCDRVLIVANRNVDAYAERAPVVHDGARGHAGPLAGLVAAFGFIAANRHVVPDWLLTVPVDCPDPPHDLAARLRAVTTGGERRCAYVQCAGGAQPVFALYRVGHDPHAWRTSAQAALREHGSVVRWHAALAAVAVDFDDAGPAFHNLNTPADFRDYQA